MKQLIVASGLILSIFLSNFRVSGQKTRCLTIPSFPMKVKKVIKSCQEEVKTNLIEDLLHASVHQNPYDEAKHHHVLKDFEDHVLQHGASFDHFHQPEHHIDPHHDYSSLGVHDHHLPLNPHSHHLPLDPHHHHSPYGTDSHHSSLGVHDHHLSSDPHSHHLPLDPHHHHSPYGTDSHHSSLPLDPHSHHLPLDPHHYHASSGTHSQHSSSGVHDHHLPLDPHHYHSPLDSHHLHTPITKAHNHHSSLDVHDHHSPEANHQIKENFHHNVPANTQFHYLPDSYPHVPSSTPHALTQTHHTPARTFVTLLPDTRKPTDEPFHKPIHVVEAHQTLTKLLAVNKPKDLHDNHQHISAILEKLRNGTADHPEDTTNLKWHRRISKRSLFGQWKVNKDIDADDPYHPKVISHEDRWLAGCLMQCVFRKNNAIDPQGYPTLDGVTDLYTLGTTEQPYFIYVLRAVDKCLKSAAIKHKVFKGKAPTKGETCDVAFDVFDCVSDSVTDYCSRP